MIKKIINDPKEVVSETMEGLILANHGKIVKVEGSNALVRPSIPEGKVCLLVGGGSGHEPLFAGFVGENLADGAVSGNVFAAPPLTKFSKPLKHWTKARGCFISTAIMPATT